MERRQTFHNWLRVHKDRIEFARKGYLQVLFDDYNHEHPEAQLKNKPELWSKHGLTLASVSHCHGGVSHANLSVMTLFPHGDLRSHSSSLTLHNFFLFTSK